jgi:hypothetical protein
MTDRMRSVRQSATDALTALLQRHGSITVEMPRPALYSVRVGCHHHDAGTLEDALNAAHLNQPAERAP